MIKISNLLKEVVFEILSPKAEYPQSIKKSLSLEDNAIPMKGHLIFTFRYQRKVEQVAIRDTEIANKIGLLKTELGSLSETYFLEQK